MDPSDRETLIEPSFAGVEVAFSADNGRVVEIEEGLDGGGSVT